MANYNAVIATVPKIQPIAGTSLPETTVPVIPRIATMGLQEPSSRRYRMRGYLYQATPPTFEEWTTGNPTDPNPSGLPIKDIVVVTTWVD